MNQIYEKLLNCSNAVKSKVKFQPEVALILGSGLGDYAKEMQVEESIEYSEIEGISQFPQLQDIEEDFFRICRRVPVVAMQGRVHFYEGYPMSDVVLPVRLMGCLEQRPLF